MYYNSFESTYEKLQAAKNDGYGYAIVQQDKTGIIGLAQLVENENHEAKIMLTPDTPEGPMLIEKKEFSIRYSFIKAIRTVEEYEKFLEKFDENRIDPIKMAETVRIFKNLVCEVALKWHQNFYGEETRGTTTEELQELRQVVSNLHQVLDPIYISGHQNFDEFSKKIMRKIYLNEEM